MREILVVPMDLHPNPCQHCAGGTTWSARETGCDDGRACTLDDRCVEGTCTAGPLRTDDGYDWILALRGRQSWGWNRLWSNEKANFVGSIGLYPVSAHALVPQGTRLLWSVHPTARIMTVSPSGDAWVTARCEPSPQVNLISLAVPAT
jgi:hypothetical protein